MLVRRTLPVARIVVTAAASVSLAIALLWSVSSGPGRSTPAASTNASSRGEEALHDLADRQVMSVAPDAALPADISVAAAAVASSMTDAFAPKGVPSVPLPAPPSATSGQDFPAREPIVPTLLVSRDRLSGARAFDAIGDGSIEQLMAELEAEAQVDPEVYELRALYREQLTELLAGSDYRIRIACGQRVCAMELQLPRGSEDPIGRGGLNVLQEWLPSQVRVEVTSEGARQSLIRRALFAIDPHVTGIHYPTRDTPRRP